MSRKTVFSEGRESAMELSDGVLIFRCGGRKRPLNGRAYSASIAGSGGGGGERGEGGRERG